MTAKQAMKWMDWFVQNDDSIEFTEEDGGMIMRVRHAKELSTFIGLTVDECIHQAMEKFPEK